jgi:biopolymer transport protein ExbD
MRIPHSSNGPRDFSVSMTPMIDVVFLLLIFFVCTASFQIPESTLPSPLSLIGSTPGGLPPELTEMELERVLIEIAQHDQVLRLSVNSQACASPARLSELLAALATIDATLPILLDIDDDTPLGPVIDIYDRCRLAGFQRIHFVTEAQQ